MTTKITSCPIWGLEFQAEGYLDEPTRTYYVDDSCRTGGGYIVPEVTLNRSIRNLDASSKARLTTWLIDQRLQGEKLPKIDENIVDYVKNRPALAIHERSDRLLRSIARKSNKVGDRVSYRSNVFVEDGLPCDPNLCNALAWSESTSETELEFYFNYLLDAGWILGDSLSLEVTVSGYTRIAELSVNSVLSQAFVAMWFGDEMDTPYSQGIEPAIKEAGYSPMRIDRKLDVEKIDDAIIAEIRRSRFLVADFTHGENGVRGGVYFEAGFAMGLGIPVFFTCRSDMVTKLHFDTRQYAHIVWSTPEQLRFALRDRILARMGSGPNADSKVPLQERPEREPFGQWLVNNIPRGTNLELPPREDPGRPNPFLDEASD